MNAKKHRRRAPKLTQKHDRGSQHRRVAEGKTNIAAKRVTLLPGFLINGFTSNTAKKAKNLENAKNKKNHLLHEDLQAYLEQKGKHPRRSQRILKKHGDQHSATSSHNSSDNRSDNLAKNPVINTSLNKNQIPANNSFKSILKNGSKSLFKEISERFSKVNLHLKEAGRQKVVPIEEIKSVNQNYDCTEASRNHLNENITIFTPIHFEQFSPPKKPDLRTGDLNASFCKNLEKQLCVVFKRKILNECRRNIRKEAETVNMVLQGKLQIDEMFCNESKSNEINEPTEDNSKDDRLPPFYPIPAQKWQYNTPPNQKIGVPQLEESQLQAGVLCQNKNQQNLYEVKPNFNGNFAKLKNIEKVPIDERFMKKVVEVKRTPANFGFGGRRDGNGVFQETWRNPMRCSNNVENDERKDFFLNPNLVNIITRPRKTARKPILTPYYVQENMPTPRSLENANEYFEVSSNFDHNLTFIEDGEDFKMQVSQSPRRSKRRQSQEELVIKRRAVYGRNESEKGKMFNFGSQEGNMFDFSKA